MTGYLSICRDTRRTPMVHSSRVMRFSCVRLPDHEQVTAQWVDNEDGVVHRCSFTQLSRFRAWLVSDQRYAPEEADSVIDGLRRQSSDNFR